MVLDLCQQLKADAYLAGNGGSRGYLDAEAFAREGVGSSGRISVFRNTCNSPGARPSSTSSVLDLIFNCGPQSGLVLQGEPRRRSRRRWGRRWSMHSPTLCGRGGPKVGK